MIDKFHALLRDNGRSVTRARTLLFEYLQRSGPVSMRQFMDDNTTIADRASLYRTAGMFRELGVLEGAERTSPIAHATSRNASE